jgi:hypothetical protein
MYILYSADDANRYDSIDYHNRYASRDDSMDSLPFPPPIILFQGSIPVCQRLLYLLYLLYLLGLLHLCSGRSHRSRADDDNLYAATPLFFPASFSPFFFSLRSGRSHRSRQDDDNVSVAESRMSDRDVSMEVLYNSALTEP